MGAGWQGPRLLATLRATRPWLQRGSFSVPLLSPTTALLFRVQMMKTKGRKCPHRQRHPCHLLCPRLQTRSLSGRTMTPRVGPAFLSVCVLFLGWLVSTWVACKGVGSPSVLGLAVGNRA